MYVCIKNGCLKLLRDWESLRDMPNSLNAGDGR